MSSFPSLVRATARLLTIALLATVGGAVRADVTQYRSGVFAEPSLLSFYPFDGDSGAKALDQVPSPQNGVMTGATFSTAAGTVGSQSIQGARVALGTVPDYEFRDGSGTVEMFLYQTATAAYNPCFFSGRDDSQSPPTRYSLHADSAGGRLYMWNGSTAPNVTTPVSMINRLVHVAVVFDSGKVSFFFNGVSRGTFDAGTGAATGRPFQIGASGPANQEAWLGRIDEVAVYGEALPAPALAAHYAAWLNNNAGKAPNITTQPVDLGVDAGSTAQFSVQLLDPAGALYRWTRNGAAIPDATNATLVLRDVGPADDQSVFRCVVYNPYGGTNSAAATLVVRTPPKLLSQTVDTLVYVGQSALLSVTASGSPPLSFQWFKDGKPVADATNASLNLAQPPVSDSGRYWVTVGNSFGSVTSTPASLAVVPVALLAPPENAVRFPGQPAFFTVGAAGAPPLSYQWFRGAIPILNETNATLLLPSVQPGDAGGYSVRVSNSLGTTNSPVALLTLLDPLAPQPLGVAPAFEWLPQQNPLPADAVLLFNEIQYHAGSSAGSAVQWIELVNVMRVDVDASNWQLDGDVHYAFLPNTYIPGGSHILIASDPAAFTAATGLAGVYGPFTTNLPPVAGHLVLRNHDGRMLDEMTYGSEAPWPEGPDGSGDTLSKRTPLSSSAEPRNWAASTRIGGTPGQPNDTTAMTGPGLVLNELDAATNSVFRVEVFNDSASQRSLAGHQLRLSGLVGTQEYGLPPLVLPPGGFAVFASGDTGLRPATDDKVFLVASNGTTLLDAAIVKNRTRSRWPDGVGRWMRSSVESFGSSNVVTLDRRMVLNEILYEGSPSYGTNGYVGSSEEWVELFNRSAAPVNLAGWTLDGGIHYSFPSNTLVPPQGYVVVARDAVALRALHPGITVLGNYSGKLAKKTDLVELKDAEQRVVSEVRYFGSGRWPGYAAGGGSSLELVDPYADERRAESWAASDEAGRSQWQTVTYRGIATRNKGYDVGDNLWREFVVGLLDAGEFLLDDVSVTELPGTAQSRQLIQNGSFEGDPPGSVPATWRVQGTHGTHGRTRVETDPSDPGNKVLHVVATGATDFLQNHLETTLKSKGVLVSVVAGREYEISFRVRWLAGCRLLNTRLYAKWLQRTTVLDVPALAGTPGAVNSRRVPSAGPSFTGLAHTPVVPAAGVPVTVSVRACDPQGVARMQLFWRVDGAAWNAIEMKPDAASVFHDRYVAQIPGQSAAQRVQFYVVGRDTLGAPASFPPDGPGSRALFAVQDGLALPSPSLNLRFIMTSADTSLLYAMTSRMSNDRLGATVVLNESEVYYDVGVRLKGSAFGRDNDTEAGLSIDFDPDHKFRGAHDSISVERSGSKREILAKHLVNQAGGGVVGGYDDVAQVITPRPQESGRCFLSMTRTTDTMLTTEYGGGGTVYNFELLYTPTTTVNGNPESAKLNFPYEHTSGAPDLQDLGDDKEAYRWNFQLRNNRVRDDSTLMIAVATSMELGGAGLDAQARKVMDVDQWLRCFAMESLVGNDDFFTRLYNHNIRFYQRPTDNRLVAVPWDLDRAFNLAATETLWGRVPDAFGGTNRIRKLFEYPPNLRAYYGHVSNLIATCYNAGYATRWADHYAALSGDSSLSGYSAYIAARAAYALGQMPKFPPFSITTSNGLAFTSTSNLVTLTGGAPQGLRYLRVNGELFDPRWPSVTNWTLSLALKAGTNLLTVEAIDAQGNPLSNLVQTTQVTVVGPVEAADTQIVFNEIHYRPAIDGAQFVELFNRSTTTAFDLAGWRLNGAALDFGQAAILPPGGFLVAAADRLRFAAAHGTAIPVALEFPGRLDPDGETLTLLRPGTTLDSTVVVDRVRYEPLLPWPQSAAGGGRSLQLLDPTQDNARVSNWSDGTGWHYFAYTGTLGGARVSIAFDALGGDVYLDDLVLVTGTVAESGANLLANGGFETGLLPGWVASGVSTNSHATNAIAHSGFQCLRLMQKPGTSSANLFYQDLASAPASGTVCTLSGWFQAAAGVTTNLTLSAGGTFQTKPPLRPMGPTPGTPNLVQSSLPSYPSVWLNEVNPWTGERPPWVEIHNPGATAVDLAGFFLSTDYAAPDLWQFPAGAVVPPGGFLIVWCDGQAGQSTGSEWHASFRLAEAEGSVVLSRALGDSLQVVDYLNYSGLRAGESYGSVPDGQPFYRDALFYPTPGAPNDGRSAPLVVFINEWMASNTSASGFSDPADGNFDDWFELYNPGPTAVDLGGYFLTDTLANPLQFEIPKNGHYLIPPGGFLLVWADGEPLQNSTNRADLHVSFSLKATGEAIGLFAADGTRIDFVSFGVQANNVSQGRSPDGSTTILSLPIATPRGGNTGGTTPTAPKIGLPVLTATGAIEFTATLSSGFRYQVESTDDLSAPVWVKAGDPITASGASLSFTLTRGPGEHRFYRIMVVR